MIVTVVVVGASHLEGRRQIGSLAPSALASGAVDG